MNLSRLQMNLLYKIMKGSYHIFLFFIIIYILEIFRLYLCILLRQQFCSP